MGKIYNNLNESNYIFEYDGLTFYFSSEFYLNKFKSEYINYLKEETLKMNVRYCCNFYADNLLLLKLYKKIEKRGFKVLYSGYELSSTYCVTTIIGNEYYEM